MKILFNSSSDVDDKNTQNTLPLDHRAELIFNSVEDGKCYFLAMVKALNKFYDKENTGLRLITKISTSQDVYMIASQSGAVSTTIKIRLAEIWLTENQEHPLYKELSHNNFITLVKIFIFEYIKKTPNYIRGNL